MKELLTDSRFWSALILLAQTLLFYLAPQFPAELWTAINTFLGVVLAILVGNSVMTKRAARRVKP